jgi:ubiquitin-conjugating enzyme (huntingtin interacting protein 2)
MSKAREFKRLEKEINDIRALSQDSLVMAETINGDLTHWRGIIQGPADTPYEGGTFYVDVSVPSDYPYSPPKIKFETKIWHPNISSVTGAICLDVLGKEWSPALTIRTALLSIQALLSSPEPDDPQDAEVAKQFKDSRPTFEKTAKFWTSTYATTKSNEQVISRLVEMGFPEASIRDALSRFANDESEALNWLLQGN